MAIVTLASLQEGLTHVCETELNETQGSAPAGESPRARWGACGGVGEGRQETVLCELLGSFPNSAGICILTGFPISFWLLEPGKQEEERALGQLPRV